MSSEHDDGREPRADLEALARLLDEHGAEERAIVEASRRVEQAPGLGVVDETVLRLAGEGRSRPGHERGDRWPASLPQLTILAAAVLVGLFFVARLVFLRPPGPEPGPGSRHLGSGGLALVEPAEETVDAYGRIEWSFPAPTGRTFTLRVVDPSRDGPDALLVEERGLRETRWTPGTDRVETWPDRIWIEIDALDATGGILGSLSVPVSRSPH